MIQLVFSLYFQSIYLFHFKKLKIIQNTSIITQSKSYMGVTLSGGSRVVWRWGVRGGATNQENRGGGSDALPPPPNPFHRQRPWSGVVLMNSTTLFQQFLPFQEDIFYTVILYYVLTILETLELLDVRFLYKNDNILLAYNRDETEKQ